MKKRIVSFIVLCAMLISMVAISTVGVSAVSTHDGRTAVYATTKPVIDGVQDPIYNTATPMDTSRGALRMLWDETGIYIFAQVKPGSSESSVIDIFISGKAYTMDTANEIAAWGWGSYKYDGNYYFRYSLSGNTSRPMWELGDHYRTPDGMQVQTKEQSYGFDVEFYLPMSASDWSYKGVGTFFGFGARLANNGWAVTGYTGSSSSPAPYSLSPVRLDANPGLPQKELKTISMHGVQTTVSDNGEFDARFVAEIASLDYDNAGFELSFTYDGKDYTKQLDTTTAYTSLLADNETVKPTKDGNYLVALVLSDIPEAANLEVNVTPYTVSDGETSYGNAVTLTLNPTTNA